MIQVLIPSDAEFFKYEKFFKELYEKNQPKICDTNSFNFVTKNTLFYAFLLDDIPVGAIYYFKDKDKLFLNGFAVRKNLEANLKCLHLSTTWFSCDIYAEAQNRASAFCLLKSGFKRVENNIFCLKKSN